MDGLEERQRQIPEWEQSYANRHGDCFEIQNNEKGIGLVATKDIKEGGVVLIDPFLSVHSIQSVHPSLESSKEYTRLSKTVEKSVRDHGAILRNWPLQAQKDLSRMNALNDTANLMDSPNLDEIWKLEDSIRGAVVDDVVMIDGLLSEQGQRLNGQLGRVIKSDRQQQGRLGVWIANEEELRSIKQTNLKTLGGIARTNVIPCYDVRGCFALAAMACRINHGCLAAFNVFVDCKAQTQKIYVVARKPIAKGEEILWDYSAEEFEDVNRKREDLYRNFNFWCECPMHHDKPPTDLY